MNPTPAQTRVFAQLPESLRTPHMLALIEFSFAEDLTPDADLSTLPNLIDGDVTSSATISSETYLEGRIYAKDTGVVAGLPVAKAVFQYAHANLHLDLQVEDGARVTPGMTLATITGPGNALLVAERPALNFLGRMSGTATLTRKMVDAAAGTKAKILDTRKTHPGFRALDKYAVRMGRGVNHRMGLYDMAMVKDNHIDGAGSIQAAVERIRAKFGDALPIEVEVKDLDELEIALTLPVQRIMLDNMSLDDMRTAVERVEGRIPLEASGNVSLGTVAAIAQTGVDFISSGALTHSAKVFDISLRLGKFSKH